MQLILLEQLPGMGQAIVVREVIGDVAMASIFRRGKSQIWWITESQLAALETPSDRQSGASICKYLLIND